MKRILLGLFLALSACSTPVEEPVVVVLEPEPEITLKCPSDDGIGGTGCKTPETDF